MKPWRRAARAVLTHRFSTTTRILVGFLLTLSAALVFLLAHLAQRVQRQYLEAAEEPMIDAAHVLAAIVEQHINASGAFDLATIREAFAAARERKFEAQIYNVTKTAVILHAYVTDRAGIVLFDSDGGRAEGQNFRAQRDVALTLLGGYGARATRADPRVSMTAMLYVAAPIRRGGEIVGVLSISKPQRSMLEFIQGTREQIWWLGLTFFLVVVLGAIGVTSVFSRPIRQLAGYARAVARGERATPPRRGAPEVLGLGRAFEEMRDALEGRKYVETYVQTLTHEMKSPLAAIRGAAELLGEPLPPERRAKFLANIQAETQRLQNQIDRLLALSAIESRKQLETTEPVALAELAAKVCAEMQPAADARGITLELRAEVQSVVRGEAFLLEMALANLLQNAIGFSPVGGAVRITLAALAPGWAEVIVEDEGPGIPDYALGRVFDRFYSLQHPATGRKSSGLGLCFVREAAELHRGEASLTNRPDRPGARAVLWLPADATVQAARL